MGSLDIFVENLNRIAKINEFEGYRELADYLCVKEGTLKCWQNKSRTPSLKQLDSIASNMNIYSYLLIKESASIEVEIEVVNNNSREVLLNNLKRIFFDYGRFTWADKASLFYGFVSEDSLKSYFRNENYKTPPLKKLDEMAEALGVPTYKLIKEDWVNEKTD